VIGSKEQHVTGSKAQHVTGNDEQHVTGNEEQHMTRSEEQNMTDNDEQLRKVLGDLTYLIRFPIMERKYFTNEVSTKNVLTLEEKVEIFQSFHDKSIYTFPANMRLLEVWRFDSNLNKIIHGITMKQTIVLISPPIVTVTFSGLLYLGQSNIADNMTSKSTS
jgi:hypothetical protein